MVLYIDPGTGSMLFTILIGIIGTGYFLLRSVIIKIKFIFRGGKVRDVEDKKIPVVIFSDHKRYWNVFEPICNEFEKMGQELVYMTASPDDPALDIEYKYVKPMFIGEGNKAFAKLNILNAYIVLSTTPGLNVYQWKRSKNVDYYLHILHSAGNASFYRMFGLDFYDGVLLSGEFQKNQIRRLEELREESPKELEYVGIPYFDELRKRVEEYDNKKQKNKKTVLVAPTWGKNGILSRYGADFLNNIQKSECNIIVRPHPQSFISEKQMIDDLMKEFPECDSFKWNKDNDNFSALMESDILISDYSGVIYEYFMIFDKPIIYTHPDIDLSPYDAYCLDEPPIIFELFSELGLELNEENYGQVDNMIEECLSNPKYKEGRRKASERLWLHKGEGTKRTVDYILNKYNELKLKKA